ncbi:MAG: hypothetical protein HY864_07450 [Chloroflexi bacterium]|nr:hypothetical protein [Chloroflexota bacterium]
MMLVIPIISIAAGYGTINYAIEKRWFIPYELLGTPIFPSLFYKSNGLMLILAPITRIQNFYAYVIAALVYILLIGGLVSLIYAIVYRIVGPSRYGPTDAPPPNIKTKRYTR